ncbi:MAG: phospholipase A [candidate division Zixibacteria bacterium]|nr:phospholipase A [candidate division Zixibacteria bacterium]
MISVTGHRAFHFCFSFLIILSAAAYGESDPEEIFQFTRTQSGLSLHKEMFMLPVTISNEYDGDRTEAVFQISAKHRIFGTKFYFAYTQVSFWQAYDSDNSAPFRETNYNPEMFYRSDRFNWLSGRLGADIGFEHESNGQIPPVSRSWNLLYAAPYYYNSNLLVYLKLRYRIPEDEKEYPGAYEGDDNPDITDYLGYSDLKIFYIFPWNHCIHVMVRGNLNTGKGGVVLSYSWPLPKSNFSFFCIRVSHGYGESLVDYNRELTRVGFGIMFAR